MPTVDLPEAVRSTESVDLPGAASYAAARRRILEIVDGLPAEPAARPVATCPGWTVHDVVAHLTGIADDVTTGRMDGLGSAAWTAAQVESRRDRALAEVCDEWRALAEPFDALLRAQPALALAAAADAVVHELDIAAAIGLAVDRSSVGVRETARRYAELAIERVANAGLGPLAVETTEGDRFAGTGDEPALVLRAPAFDVLEALTGRRTVPEVLALPWRGDAEAAVAHLSPYGMRASQPGR